MTQPLCPACIAPAPVDADGRIGKHPEQIVTAYGWGDGYNQCHAAGRPPYGVRITTPAPTKTKSGGMTVPEREMQLIRRAAAGFLRRNLKGHPVIDNGTSIWQANATIVNGLLDQELLAFHEEDGRFRPTVGGNIRLAVGE